MPTSIRLCFYFIAVAFTGCVFFNDSQKLPELPLLPPADFWLDTVNEENENKSEQFLEQVTLDNGTDEQVLLAAWVVTVERIELVGLTPTGQRLLSLSYDGQEFNEDYSSLLEEPIPGRMVLAHLQLAHWPEQSIVSNLEKSPWRMSVSDIKRDFYLQDEYFMTIYRDTVDKTLIHIDSEKIGLKLSVKQLTQENESQ